MSDAQPPEVLPPDTLLQVENLSVTFGTGDGMVEAVQGVSFEIRRGETLALGSAAAALSGRPPSHWQHPLPGSRTGGRAGV